MKFMIEREIVKERSGKKDCERGEQKVERGGLQRSGKSYLTMSPIFAQ